MTVDSEKVEHGLTLRRRQQEARNMVDQAGEEYGRFLDSLTDEELRDYVSATQACD